MAFNTGDITTILNFKLDEKGLVAYKSAVKSSKAGETITTKLEVDSTQATKNLGDLKRSLTELNDEQLKSIKLMRTSDGRIRDLKGRYLDLNATVEEGINHQRNYNDGLRVTDDRLSRVIRRTRSADASFKSMGRGLGMGAGLAGLVGPATQGVEGLAGAIGALGSSMAPVGASIAAAPGLIAPLVQGFGVVAIASQDLTEALGGNEEALDRLTDSGYRFVKTLQSYKGEFNQLKTAAQEPLFAGVTDGLKAAMTNFDVLKQSFADTGKVIGDFARSAGQMLGSGVWGRDLATISGNNVQILGKLGKGIMNLATALKDLMIAANPFTQWVADVALGWTRWARAQAAAGRETGAIARYLDETKSKLQLFGSILSNTVQIIAKFSGAGKAMGDGLFKSLDQALGRLNRWLSTKEGQKALDEFYARTERLMKAFGPLVSEVWRFFSAMNQGEGLTAMVKGITALAKGLNDAGIAKALTFITRSISSVISWVGRLISTVSKTRETKGAFKEVSEGIKQAFKDIKPFLNNVILPLARGIGKSLLDALKVAVKILGLLAKALGWVGQKAAPFKKEIETLGYIIGAVFGPWILKAISWLSRLGRLIPGLGGIMRGLGAAVNALAKPWQRLYEILGKVASRIPGVGGALKTITGAPGKALEKIGLRANGGVTNGAEMYIAGEDGPEVIVPVGPKYRDQGMKWLGVAASALGVPMFAQGGLAGATRRYSQLRSQQSQASNSVSDWTRVINRDGKVTPAESKGLLARQSKLKGLYQAEVGVVSQLISLNQAEVARLSAGRQTQAKKRAAEERRQKVEDFKARASELRRLLRETDLDMGDTRQDARDYLKDRNEAKKDKAKEAKEKAKEKKEQAKQKAEERRQKLLDSAPANPFQGAIQALENQMKLGRNVDKGQLLSLYGQARDFLLRRFDKSGNDPQLQGGIADAVEAIRGRIDELNPSLSGGAGGLGFQDQVANLNSARMQLFSQAGNTVGMTNNRTQQTVVNQQLTFTRPPENPHLWANQAADYLRQAI